MMLIDTDDEDNSVTIGESKFEKKKRSDYMMKDQRPMQMARVAKSKCNGL